MPLPTTTTTITPPAPPPDNKDEFALLRRWFPSSPITTLSDARVRLSHAEDVLSFKIAWGTEQELELYSLAEGEQVPLHHVRSLARNFASITIAFRAAITAWKYVEEHTSQCRCEEEEQNSVSAQGKNKTNEIEEKELNSKSTPGKDRTNELEEKEDNQVEINKGVASNHILNETTDRSIKTIEQVNKEDKHVDSQFSLEVTDSLKSAENNDDPILAETEGLTSVYKIDTDNSDDTDTDSNSEDETDTESSEDDQENACQDDEDVYSDYDPDQETVKGQERKRVAEAVRTKFYDLFGVTSKPTQRNWRQSGYDMYTIVLPRPTPVGRIKLRAAGNKEMIKWRPPLHDIKDQRWIAFANAILDSFDPSVPRKITIAALETYRKSKWSQQKTEWDRLIRPVLARQAAALSKRQRHWPTSPFAKHPLCKILKVFLLSLSTVPKTFEYGQFEKFKEGDAEYLLYLPIGIEEEGCDTLLSQGFAWMTAQAVALVCVYDGWVKLQDESIRRYPKRARTTQTLVFDLPKEYWEIERPEDSNLPRGFTDLLKYDWSDLTKKLVDLDSTGHFAKVLVNCKDQLSSLTLTRTAVKTKQNTIAGPSQPRDRLAEIALERLGRNKRSTNSRKTNKSMEPPRKRPRSNDEERSDAERSSAASNSAQPDTLSPSIVNGRPTWATINSKNTNHTAAPADQGQIIPTEIVHYSNSISSHQSATETI